MQIGEEKKAFFLHKEMIIAGEPIRHTSRLNGRSFH
jgi:hypothetical protein